MDHQLIDNEEKKQYEFHIDDLIPRIEYIKAQGTIYLTHTEVPPRLKGQGIGAELVRQVLEDIKEKDLTLVPLCPFVATYISKNPEWKQLVLKGVNIR